MKMKLFLPALALCGVLVLGGTAVPAHAGVVDTQALIAQVSLCKVVHGFIKAPCAGKLLGEKLLPNLFPLQVSGLRASQTLIDLDTGDWKSKAAGWINQGLDWLGIPDRYRIPKKIGYDFGIGVQLSNVSLAIPKGNEYQPSFGATLRSELEVLSSGPFKGKKFVVNGRVEGKVYLTVAPYGPECAAGKVDWTMAIVNIELTKLDVDKIPDFIDGSELFKSILNWAVSSKFEDYPQYNTRGLAVCLRGNCPLPAKAVERQAGLASAVANKGVLKLGGLTASNRWLEAAPRADGSVAIRLKDAGLLCQLMDDVTRLGCTDNFINTMASTLLPLRLPVPENLAGPGLSVSADQFTVDLRNPAAPVLLAKASLRKQGQAEALSLTLGTKVELRSQCTAKSFLVLLRPTIESVALSALPAWLVDGLGRAAINSHLQPLDFCFKTFVVPTFNKAINACKLTDALLREQCTGPLVSAVADSLFPLSIRPADATFVKTPALKALLAGVTLQVQRAQVNVPMDGRNPRIDVQVALRKDGEKEALLTAATAGFGVEMKCGKEDNAVRITPSVEKLSVSKLPAWLLKSTVVNLGNSALSHWQALCAYGDCKTQQKIDIQKPDLGLALGQGAAPACSFDTFVGGK